MADSTIATRDVENWIRNEFLPKKYAQAFAKRKLGVQSGGEFECDAVSEDGKIVCFISTSPSKTADGKPDADELAKSVRKLFGRVLSVKNRKKSCLHLQTNQLSRLSSKKKRMDASQSTLRRCW